MKTKNIFKTLAAAMLMPTMLLTTACSNDDEIVNTENPANAKGYTLPVTVNVTRQGDDATTRATYTYDEDTKKGTLSFSTGDKLFVAGDHTGAGSFAGVLDYDAVSGKFSGTIYTESEYTGTAEELLSSAADDAEALLIPAGYKSYEYFELDDEITPNAGYYQNKTNAFALTKAAAVEQFSFELAETYSSGFTLSPQNAIVSFTISGLTASKEVAVSFDTYSCGVISKSVTTSAEGVATFAIGLDADIPLENCTLTVDGNNIAMPTKTVEAGHIYNISRSVPSVPEGAINGRFSVSDTKKVYFSKGNLQATYNTSWTWAFATNQWDYIGNAAGNTSINGGGTISGTGTVDLFGWVGAACTWTGAAQYGISNVTTANQYGNVAGEALKSDWGTLAITNGGNTANFGWHSLASSEWDYLFKTRTTPSGVRYAHATVNSVPGLVLLPDDWSTDYYSLDKVNDANSTAYTDNVISSSDWTSKLEAHGAVFLPAGGYRNGATVSDAGVQGTYWSSTSSTTISARGFYFKSATFMGNTQNFVRNRGCSVRLVYDAN